MEVGAVAAAAAGRALRQMLEQRAESREVGDDNAGSVVSA